ESRSLNPSLRQLRRRSACERALLRSHRAVLRLRPRLEHGRQGVRGSSRERWADLQPIQCWETHATLLMQLACAPYSLDSGMVTRKLVPAPGTDSNVNEPCNSSAREAIICSPRPRPAASAETPF